MAQTPKRTKHGTPRRQLRGLCFAQLIGVSAALLLTPMTALTQDLRTDIPPLLEIDRLDPEGSRIERFAFTARGAIARGMEIPNSQNRMCTLGQAHNVVLNYYPTRDAWVFQVQNNDGAQFAAGGIATCLDLTQIGAPE